MSPDRGSPTLDQLRVLVIVVETGSFAEVDDPTIVDLKESVRAMIEKIVVWPQEEAPSRIELQGRFAGVMAATGLLESYEEREPANANSPVSCEAGELHSLVAGAGFEPAAFRL